MRPQAKERDGVSEAGTRWHAKLTVLDRLASRPPKDGVVQSGHDHFSVLGISGIGRPNSLATFF